MELYVKLLPTSLFSLWMHAVYTSLFDFQTILEQFKKTAEGVGEFYLHKRCEIKLIFLFLLQKWCKYTHTRTLTSCEALYVKTQTLTSPVQIQQAKLMLLRIQVKVYAGKQNQIKIQ